VGRQQRKIILTLLVYRCQDLGGIICIFHFKSLQTESHPNICNMKSKDLKLMRKKLAKANKTDYCPSPAHSQIALVQDVVVSNGSRNGDPTGEEEAKLSESPSKMLSIQYCPLGNLPENRFQQCLGLFEENMGDMYRNSSWSLNIEEKKSEMKHDSARFILVCGEDGQDLAAFVHYRFEYDDEDHPTQVVLYVYEIQTNQSYRRKGLGKQLMDIVETIAEQAEMPKVVLTVFKANKGALDFYQKLNYNIDESSPSKFNEPADYEILSQKIPAKR
jgi:ribosomal protein S18 acetylase RimI-like enzyme